MLLIDQAGKPHLACENRAPKRNGRRASLRAIRADEKFPKARFRWPVYPNPITMRTMRQYEAYLRGRELA